MNEAAKQPAPAETGWVRDDKYALLGSLLLIVLFYYMSVSPDLFHRIEYKQDVLDAPNPFLRSLKLLVLSGAAGIVVWRHRLAGLILKQINIFLLIFVGLVTCSILWSISPSATGARLVSVSVILLGAFAFTLVSWHRTRFQDNLRPLLTALLIASLIYWVLAPGLAVEESDAFELKNSWKGIFTQKNQLGQVASLSVIFWVHGWLAKEVRLTLLMAGGGVSATLLLLSRSSTSLLATTFVVVFLFLLLGNSGRPRHRSTKYLAIISVFLFLLYSLAALNLVPSLNFLLEPLTAVTGKDTTFSGRTAIWTLVREHITLHPMLGTGYEAFFLGTSPTSPAYYMKAILYTVPPEAHNGYLDVINDLGFVGLVILIAYIISYMRQSLALLKYDFTQGTLFLAILLQQLIANMTESIWWNGMTIGFVVMSLATMALARAHVQRTLQDQLQPAASATSSL